MIHNILKFLFGTNKSSEKIDRICIWTAASTLITLGLLVLAWAQLNNLNLTAKADFAHKFSEDFFIQKSQNLIMLFDYGVLKFKLANINNDEFPYFEVDQKKLDSLYFLDDKDKKDIKKFYSEFDIDDDLLGYLDDIENYQKKGLLDIQLIDQTFGSYITAIWEDSEIQKYINWCRKQFGNDMYKGMEDIYNKLKTFNRIELQGTRYLRH